MCKFLVQTVLLLVHAVVGGVRSPTIKVALALKLHSSSGHASLFLKLRLELWLAARVYVHHAGGRVGAGAAKCGPEVRTHGVYLV